MVCTANETEPISAPVLDRLDMIAGPVVRLRAQLSVVEAHLWQRLLERHSPTVDQVEFSVEARHLLWVPLGLAITPPDFRPPTARVTADY